MGILKRRSNKKYDYSPRFYDNGGEGSPFKMKQRFDEHRTTIDGSKGLVNKFKSAWADYRDNENQKATRRTLYIIAVLVLIFLYLIDFDLSIFSLAQ
jgi:hypothetical protein